MGLEAECLATVREAWLQATKVKAKIATHARPMRVQRAAAAVGYAFWSARSRNCCSVITATFSRCAFSSLEPAASPATT